MDQLRGLRASSFRGRASGRKARARAGFTLLEVMVALVVLAMALPSLLTVILYHGRLVEMQRESSIAQAALREQVERIKGTPFDQVFARYNTNPADDPGGPGTAAGAGFAVPGLDVRAGDADGLAGQVEFPTAVGVGGGLELREDVVDARFGMPRDLDADGAIDALDHATDRVLLPVRVRILWQGKSGDRELWVDHLLSYP